VSGHETVLLLLAAVSVVLLLLLLLLLLNKAWFEAWEARVDAIGEKAWIDGTIIDVVARVSHNTAGAKVLVECLVRL
jgi:hypothetical protein